MRKIFGLFIFMFMFLNLFLFIPTNNNNLNISTKSENNIVMHDGENYTEVRDAQGFIDAANANENILIMNDISFAEISSTTTIETYSGNIDGQYYTLSNHNYEKNYDDENFIYLFQNFSGSIKNITFSQFPFLFYKTTGDGDDSTYELENISFTNATISNINYEGTLGYVNGLLLGTGTDLNIKNLAFTNISFIDNTMYLYMNSGNGIYFGFFAGQLVDCTLSEVYLLNLNMTNNILDSQYTDSTHQTVQSSGTGRVGIFMARSVDTAVNDIIINGLNFSNNYLASHDLHFGIFIGAYNISSGNTIMQRVYSTNITANNNTFVTELSQNSGSFLISSFIGNTSYNGDDVNADKVTYSSIVISDFIGDSSSNVFKLTDGTVVNDGKFSEITSETTAPTTYESMYFINDSGTGDSTDYSYAKPSELTTDFWTNDVDFSGSVWNLDVLFDSNLNISSDLNGNQEIYGFPLFTSFNYINVAFNESATKESETYVIDADYVPAQSATSAKIGSIFGDNYTLSTNNYDSYEFDTGLSTEIPIENIYDYFWIDLQKNNQSETNVILGNISATSPIDLYESNPQIVNEGSFIYSESVDNNNLTFSSNLSYDYVGIEDYNLLINDPSTFNLIINDADGTQYTLNSENLTLSLPTFVDETNLNTYYQIDTELSNSSIEYVSTDKTIKETPLTISEDSDLTNVDPVTTITPPTFTMTSTSDFTKDDISTSKENYIDFQIVVNGDYKLLNNEQNQNLFETTMFTVNSTFYEFGTQQSPSTSVDVTGADFVLDEETGIYEYKLALQSDIPANLLNDYYFIEYNDSFQMAYYSDLSGNTTILDNPVTIDEDNSDLTNTSIIQQYDTDKDFTGFIETNYDQVANILTFNLVDQENYPYELSYEVNLVLNSSKDSQSFTLTNEEPEAQIELDPSIPYNLVNSPEYTINDYYSLSLDQNKESYINYINNTGSISTQTFTSIVAEQNVNSKNINTDLIVGGDLTHITNPDGTDPDGNETNLITPIKDPSLEDTSLFLEPTAIMIYILILFLILFFLYYIRVVVRSKHSYKH